MEIYNSRYKIDIYIHDNSPEAQDFIFSDAFTYHHNTDNSGVSHAYNCGFGIAQNKRKNCVLLLDQDTTFKIDNLIEYENAYREYLDDFIYAPNICDSKKNKLYSPARLERYVGHTQPYSHTSSAKLFLLKELSVINSGLMIPVPIFKKIGGFNEKIKLDFSDVYFIEKYKDINQYLVLLPIELIHSLSGDEGFDKERELHRFKFFCNGARELARSLQDNTVYTTVRRMARLIIKYRTLEPLKIVKNYYFGDKLL